MKRLLASLLLILPLAAPALAQQPIRAPQVITNELDVQSQPLAPVSQLSANVIGGTGNATYYYWVVAVYSSGKATASAYAQVVNAPSALTGSNYVAVSWTPQPGAISYDLLRTTTPSLPNTPASIAVSTAIAGTTFNDQGAALSSYTLTPAAMKQISILPLCITFSDGTQQCTAAAGSSITLQTNGVNNASQTLLNFQTSTVNASGLTVTPSNPSGGAEKFEVTGVPVLPSAAPNQAVIYVSPNCNGQTNCFQVKDDGFMATDCSVTSGSPTVTCASSHFTSGMADGLHHIAVYKTCSTDAGLGNYVTELGATGATISTFTSGTSITASANATGTVTGTACVFVASLDDTALSNADTAAQASPTCPVIDLPAGIMGTKEPHFYTLPASCSIDGRVTGESAYAPMFVIEGQGGAVSTFWFTPDFDFAACTHGAGSHACMMDDFTLFKNWGITGGGLPTIPATTYLISNDIVGHVTGYLDGFQCVNIGPNSSSPTSEVGQWVGSDALYVHNSVFDGCGASAAHVQGNSKLITFQSAWQDSGQAEIDLTGNTAKIVSLGGNFFYGASGMVSFKNLIQGGTVSTAPGDDFKTNGGPATLRCWQSNSTLGQSFYMDGAFCDAGQGIVVQNTGVTVTLRDSQLTSTTPIIISSGAPVIADYGNNTLGGAPSGTFTVTQSQSILGAQVATNITPSTGWGTTGAVGNGVSAASGTSQSERFTITAAGTPTANPTVAITFPQAFWAAPLCTSEQIGGTGAIQALTTGATETTTGVTLTWHGTAVAASTYIIQVNCK